MQPTGVISNNQIKWSKQVLGVDDGGGGGGGGNNKDCSLNQGFPLNSL